MNENLPMLKSSTHEAFRARLRGRLLMPGDLEYDAARQVWNGAIDRRPTCIIRCADAEDVAHAVRTAADNGLTLTIRGGGHNVAGRSISDGKVLLDLSGLRHVSVNRESRIATVQGGALWRDVDAASATEGLATTGGLVSSTGVGGFTLGGGAGWLMRKHGLACDNVRSVGVVLADGRFVRATTGEHADLYWGLRGGGGGLGVVTSFEFALHAFRRAGSRRLALFPRLRRRCARRILRNCGHCARATAAVHRAGVAWPSGHPVRAVLERRARPG